MPLQFNSGLAFQGLRNAVIRAADRCLEGMYAEINQNMRTEAARNAITRLSENEERYFIRKVIGGANAILDSYGTGSKMDESNPTLDEYKQSSLWNPFRTSNAIAGRKKGYYINILGRKVYSSGRKVGMNIEDEHPPREPSFAFQRAERWWFANKSRVTEILNEELSAYFSQMHRYFTYTP